MAFCKCVSEEFVRKSLIASPFITFGERAARLTILAKLAILAIFCQFCQISSSIGIDTKGMNCGDIGDFGEFDKFGNFGDILPISSN